MTTYRKRLSIAISVGLLGLMMLLWPQIAVILGNPRELSGQRANRRMQRDHGPPKDPRRGQDRF